MNRTQVICLAIAVVAAVLAAMMFRAMTSQPPQVVEAAPETLEVEDVLVVSLDVLLGQKLNTSDLRWQPWPAAAVSERYILKSREPEALEIYDGARVRFALIEGEPVLDSKVVKDGASGLMSALLARGQRAVSIGISAETAAGGFILPNDHVDVILTHRVSTVRGSEQIGTDVSETILRNVRVLAIDQAYREIEGEQVLVGETATLELGVGEAEILALAGFKGTISLALRSLADSQLGEGEEGEVGFGQARVGSTINLVRYGISTVISGGGRRE